MRSVRSRAGGVRRDERSSALFVVDGGRPDVASRDGHLSRRRDSGSVAYRISIDRAHDSSRRATGLHRHRRDLLHRCRSSGSVDDFAHGRNSSGPSLRASRQHGWNFPGREETRALGGRRLRSSFWSAVSRPTRRLDCGREQLAEFLKGKGIGTGIHYPVPNHQQPAIMKLYSDLPRLPKTEAAVNEILSLPIYGDLPMEDVDYVCDAVLEFFGKK